MLSCKAFTCKNEYALLKYHRQSLLGAVIDFKITFNTDETAVEEIMKITSDLFQSLCDEFTKHDATLKADLAAKVRYWRVSTDMEESYWHASSPSETVENPVEFFKKHMLKIGTRIDKMNERGSMLMIVAIEEIHARLSVLD